MKKVLVLCTLIISMTLVGCSSGTSSSNDLTTASTVDAGDLSAVEGSLVANRLLAAETITDSSANISASLLASQNRYRYKNRNYDASTDNSALSVSRGLGTCKATFDGTTLTIASETCNVVKLSSGGYQITRGNGSILELQPASEDGSIQTLSVDGITWEANYGSDTTGPVVSLKNLRSGRILNVYEDDSGNITITRDDSSVVKGRWNSDGTIDLEDGNGRQYRYRHGQTL